MSSDQNSQIQDASDIFSQSGLNSLVNGKLQPGNLHKIRNQLQSLEYVQIKDLKEFKEVINHWKEKLTSDYLKIQMNEVNHKMVEEKRESIQKYLQSNSENIDIFYQLLTDKELIEKLRDLQEKNSSNGEQ